MRITHFLAAVTMIAGLGVGTAASAQDYRHDDRQERRYDHRSDNRGHGWRGGERRHGYNGHRRACRTEYRHHRRVTVCYR